MTMQSILNHAAGAAANLFNTTSAWMGSVWGCQAPEEMRELIQKTAQVACGPGGKLCEIAVACQSVLTPNVFNLRGLFPCQMQTACAEAWVENGMQDPGFAFCNQSNLLEAQGVECRTQGDVFLASATAILMIQTVLFAVFLLSHDSVGGNAQDREREADSL